MTIIAHLRKIRIKKLMSFVFLFPNILAIASLFIVTLALGFTSDYYVQIYDPTQLYEMSDYSLKYHVRNQYLDLGKDWIPIGTKEKPFSGIFDGGGVTITTINYGILTTNDDALFGFFGYVTGTIKNINIYIYNGSAILDDNIDKNILGSLLVCESHGIIENCSINYYGNIDFENGNGLFGTFAGINYGLIKNCKARGRITATNIGKEGISFGSIVAEDYGQCNDVSSDMVFEHEY